MAETTTVIGATMTISGEVHCEENIEVHGMVRGRLETTAALTVVEGASIEADVAARSMEVRGAVVGDVMVAERFEILPGGSVTGDIVASRVVLGDGCKFKGHINMDPEAVAGARLLEGASGVAALSGGGAGAAAGGGARRLVRS